MNVLSLFDGMSCGRIALDRIGVSDEINNYFASEIDRNAIKVSKDNWSDIDHIGDVTKVSYKNGFLYTENGTYGIDKVDLLIGGSPCQDFSSAKAFGTHGLPQKYYVGHPMTVQSIWVLYEACRRLKEEDNEKSFT